MQTVHSIHECFSTKVQKLIHRHSHKGCQLHQMTICRRHVNSLLGFTASEYDILICLVSHKKGRDLCWKEQPSQLKMAFKSSPVFNESLDFQIAKSIEQNGECNLTIKWKNGDQAWILSFANTQIRDQWIDILTEAKKNNILNGVQDLMEESANQQTQKTNQNSSFVCSQVASLIDIDELQTELTIDCQLSVDEIKAKFTKLLTTQADTEKIVNLVVDTLKYHFDAQQQLKQLKENSKKESLKLSEMEKQLIQVKACKSQLESEVVELKKTFQQLVQQLDPKRQKSQILEIMYKSSRILKQDNQNDFDQVDRGLSSKILQEINESLNQNREHRNDQPIFKIKTNSAVLSSISLDGDGVDFDCEEFDDARESLMKKDKDNAIGFVGYKQQA